MSLPAQIKALMGTTVTWERFIGQDGHADPKYAAPRDLKCWIEEKGASGGLQRKQSSGLTTIDPKVDVYLDAGDVDASTISVGDRFTWGINGQEFTTKPDRVSVVLGEDASPWCVVVQL